jgi:hypothetical protein
LTSLFFNINPTSLSEPLLAIDSTPTYYAGPTSCFGEQKNKKNEKSAHLPSTTPSRCNTTSLTGGASPTKSNAAVERKRTDLRSTYENKKTKNKKKKKKKKKKKSSEPTLELCSDDVASTASIFPKADLVHSV